MRVAFRKLFRAIPRNWLLRFVSLGTLRVYRVLPESFLGEATLISQVSPSSVVRASWSNDSLSNHALGAPRKTLSFRKLSRISVSANSRGGFLSNDRYIFTPDTGFCSVPKLYYPNTSVAGLLEQKDREVLARFIPANSVIENGIFVGSMAAHNWFHWIIDTLPTVYFSRYLPQKYSAYPLFVSARGVSKPNWLEPLQAVTGGREIFPLDPNLHYRVTNLVRLDSVTRPAPRALGRKIPARISVYADYLLEYRDFLLSHFNLHKVTPDPEKKLFLARKPSSLRRYNQAEIADTLASLGFELLFIEDLGFRDSIRAFRESSIIVGPHSAGWANMLFCSPVTKTVMWTWSGEVEDNWYENVAFTAGVQFRQIHTFPSNSKSGLTEDPRTADYFLDPGKLVSAISN